MTTIEKAIHISENNEQDYKNKLNREIQDLRKHDLNYSVYESRYNSPEHGYKAEIAYEFEIEESYYEYYC